MNKKYFSCCLLDQEFDLHETLEEAKLSAEAHLEYYRDAASDDGWEEVDNEIMYGEVHGIVEKLWSKNREELTKEERSNFGMNDEFDEYAEYGFKEQSK